jgi:RimJ/RimL family protein N-acetyltransferase
MISYALEAAQERKGSHMRLWSMGDARPHRSERLIYVPLGAEHGPTLFAALSDPAVYRFIDCSAPLSIEELANDFAKKSSGPPPHRAGETWWNFAVFDSASGQGVGRLEATLIADRAEVAYLFGSAFWGVGIGGEALDWLHGQLREHAVQNFWATTRPDNVRSVRMLERLGYTLANTFPHLASYDPGDAVYWRPATA